MSEVKNLYCYNCLTKIGDNKGDFCAECGKRHSRHFGQSNELPAGTYLNQGRYFVGKSIGSGGFGITYIGYDTKLEKKILIKETFYFGIFNRNIHDIDDPEPLKVKYGREFSLENIMKKTRKECISLSEGEGLNNIVKVYDWFSENNTAYIITEFINGCTLAERVRDKGRYKWDELYSKIKPLIISLQKLHEKGIIHRDIKPQNIMIRDIEGIGEEFILIDFGLARSNETKTLASVGVSFSPGYSPYEQRSFLMRDGTYTDVYSLAATIYFALTGEDPSADMMNTLEGNFPMIKYLKGQYGVPENVVDALANALNAKYEERTQTIKELLKSFEKKGRNTVIEEPYSNTFAEEDVSEPINYAAPPTPAKNNIPRQQENQQTQQDKNKEYEQILKEAKASIDLPQQKKSKTPIIAAIAAVVVVVGIIVGVTMMKGGSSGSEPKADNSEKTESSENSGSSSESGITLEQMKKNAELLNNALDEAEKEHTVYDSDFDLYFIDDNSGKKYNGHDYNAAIIHDLCIEQGIDDSQNFYNAEIGGKKCYMMWTSDNKIEIIEEPITEYKYTDGFYDSDKVYMIGEESDDKFGRLIQSDLNIDYCRSDIVLSVKLDHHIQLIEDGIMTAVDAFKANNDSITWNGKNAYKATVHDVCAEYGIDDSASDFYQYKYEGKGNYLSYDGVICYDVNPYDDGYSDSKFMVGHKFLNNEYNDYKFIVIGDTRIGNIANNISGSDGYGKDNNYVSVVSWIDFLKPEIDTAVEEYEKGEEKTKWNGKTASALTIDDIMKSHHINDYSFESNDSNNNVTYTLGWTKGGNLHQVNKEKPGSTMIVTSKTTIKELVEFKSK